MSSEDFRLKELNSYQILDSSPDNELDELTEIASLVCEVPISLITMIDENRQWFKSNKGLNVNETLRKDSFCQHTLHKPKEVLIITDSLKDERFKNNPLVEGAPNIRFYAGAPLETPNGNVLGTLCVIDSKPKNISEKQQRVLQILAKKAMDYLNTRKLIWHKKIRLNPMQLNSLN